MDCIYFCYQLYCDKFIELEKQLYGYADLTEHKCGYKDCQNKCQNYVKGEKK